jgi:hypothetical protein
MADENKNIEYGVIHKSIVNVDNIMDILIDFNIHSYLRVPENLLNYLIYEIQPNIDLKDLKKNLKNFYNINIGINFFNNR